MMYATAASSGYCQTELDTPYLLWIHTKKYTALKWEDSGKICKIDNTKMCVKEKKHSKGKPKQEQGQEQQRNRT